MTPIQDGDQSADIQSDQGHSNSTGNNSGNSQNWDHLFPKEDQIDLQKLHTPKTNKGIANFTIPKRLIEQDKRVIDLIIRSESMKDQERQYWFNLTEVMNEAHLEKLRGILKKERIKLAEIESKYKKPKIDPVLAAKQAEALAQKRSSQQAAIAQKEAKIEAKEVQEEADILSQLEGL